MNSAFRETHSHGPPSGDFEVRIRANDEKRLANPKGEVEIRAQWFLEFDGSSNKLSVEIRRGGFDVTGSNSETDFQTFRGYWMTQAVPSIIEFGAFELPPAVAEPTLE